MAFIDFKILYITSKWNREIGEGIGQRKKWIWIIIGEDMSTCGVNKNIVKDRDG